MKEKTCSTELSETQMLGILAGSLLLGAGIGGLFNHAGNGAAIGLGAGILAIICIRKGWCCCTK